MKPANRLVSACKHCRFYQSEGRRGGECSQLGAPVQSNWKACCLASHPFSASWKEIEEMMTLQHALSLQEIPVADLQISESLMRMSS